MIRNKNITVKELTEVWLKTEKEPYLREQTLMVYRNHINKRIVPSLGDWKVRKLTRQILQEKYLEIFAGKDKLSGEATISSDSIIKQFAVIMNMILEYAVKENILKDNPHKEVLMPRGKSAQKVWAYTTEEQEKLIFTLKKNIYKYSLYYFILATGLRYGEAVAIEWDDVNFEKKEITINKTVVEISGRAQIQNVTKTSAGERIVYFSDKLKNLLLALYEFNAKKETRNPVIFVNSKGNICHSSDCRRSFKRICEEAQIPYRGIHALRHTWATRALEAGIDIKTVSTMLGHKNIMVTMNVYQDVLRSHKIAAMDKMETFI